MDSPLELSINKYSFINRSRAILVAYKVFAQLSEEQLCRNDVTRNVYLLMPMKANVPGFHLY